ncbi:MAG: hypothetical protein ACKO44_08800 [Algoriphagus sp.]
MPKTLKQQAFRRTKYAVELITEDSLAISFLQWPEATGTAIEKHYLAQSFQFEQSYARH